MTASMDERGIPWPQVVNKAVHDMRTPLSAMKTTLEVMRLSKDDPEKAAKLIAMLERQTNEISGLMHRLVEDPGSYIGTVTAE
mgnify:CR=1 FL=1|jgi:signal transduction histidine kinase